nr:DUF3575 domain-containing protein [uncultured Psychroserpens sp.]
MKKSILCSLIILLSMSLYAQDNDTTNDDSSIPKNEVKANALYMVLGAFDITYERLLNEESAAGLNVVIPFDDDIDDLNYYISPYYRLYFGKKYASGFFLEGFGLLSSANNRTAIFIDPFDSVPVIREEKVTDFALGIGLGGKWVTNNGFIGEIGFGVGRNLTNTDDNTDDFIGKVNITVGYRF